MGAGALLPLWEQGTLLSPDMPDGIHPAITKNADKSVRAPSNTAFKDYLPNNLSFTSNRILFLILLYKRQLI